MTVFVSDRDIADPTGIGLREPLEGGLHRIAAGQFAKAVGGLRLEPDRDGGVHMTRKALKRLRALLRLVGSPIGAELAREENVVLRDMGRRLAPLRDARVMIDTLDDLDADPGGLRDWLMLRHRDEAAALLTDPQEMAHLVTSLRCARERWASSLDHPGRLGGAGPIPDSFDSVRAGLKREYRRCRKDLIAVRAGAGNERVHSWRKHVKYLRYQLEALRALAPAELGGAIAYLDDLGEVLGSEHDHAELARLVTERAKLTDGSGAEHLASVLEERRAQQHAEAVRLGGLLFGEPPGRFVDHIGELWARVRPGSPASPGAAVT